MSVFERPGNPTVSVVIPTFNRRDLLRRLLLTLEREPDRGACLEVVVSIDGATDGTAEMLAKLDTRYPLRVLVQCNRGPAAARNRAIRAASGDVLVFLDDDVVPVTALIERHLAIHRRDPAAVVIGPILPPAGQIKTPWARWEAAKLQKHCDWLRAGRRAPAAADFYTGNASVRREHALAVGGFNESFARAEDREFGYRLADRALRFYFVPAAAVLHESDHTFQDWLCIPYKYGHHDVVMARDYGRLDALPRCRRRVPVTWSLARWSVGHPRRRRAALAVFSRLLTYAGPGAPTFLQVAFCSLVYHAQYWQGVADATGLGAAVWRRLDQQLAGSARHRAVIDASRTT